MPFNKVSHFHPQKLKTSMSTRRRWKGRGFHPQGFGPQQPGSQAHVHFPPRLCLSLRFLLLGVGSRVGCCEVSPVPGTAEQLEVTVPTVGLVDWMGRHATWNARAIFHSSARVFSRCLSTMSLARIAPPAGERAVSTAWGQGPGERPLGLPLLAAHPARPVRGSRGTAGPAEQGRRCASSGDG